MKKIRIAMCGMGLNSVNYGVNAFSFVQIYKIENYCKEVEIKAEYVLFSNDNENEVNNFKEKYNIKSDIIIKDCPRIKTGFESIKSISNEFKQCDMVIDMAGGDSFSDIYGVKTFYLHVIEKLIAIRLGIPLVIGPQTIGPFNNFLCKKIAKYMVNYATIVSTRDILSYDYTKELSGKDNLLLSSDLAMSLPYDNRYHFDKNTVNVGINISSLLWFKNKKNTFSLKVEYDILMRRIIKYLLDNNYTVYLIAHEYTSDLKSEYQLAKQLKEEYPQVDLAPFFEDAIDAKSYLSALDLFIGARMHATIGAFSAGVPVIPISYSRKFEGLYNSINYMHTINCKTLTTDEAFNQTVRYICIREQLKDIVDSSMSIVNIRNDEYDRSLFDLVKRVCK